MEDVGYRSIFTILKDAHILITGIIIVCIIIDIISIMNGDAATIGIFGWVGAWIGIVWCDQISRKTGGSVSWAAFYGLFGLVGVFLYWLARKIQTGK